MAALLDVKVEVRGLERLPRTGRLVVVCNHPTGIADGIAVYEAIRAVRPDLIFFANADAMRVSPRLDEVLIPVEWVEEKRTCAKTRDTLAHAKAALESERALVVFPAGRLARREGGALTDPPWQASALSLARKYQAPVAPMHMEGPWSALFHVFDRFSRELRDITLFHELLNKKGKTFRLTIGEPVAPERLGADAVPAMKAHVERALAADPDAVFA